ncbi:MAG TPA: gamma-glutamylcyclotransferase [Afifellaceae bacterium]|nr:gamma-glutamylcyclotransferase [Afifellaceae bacterium]
MSEFWVFGYGSLMWRPGFAHAEIRPARLAGVHRSLCVYSWVHRGTREQPGLVLGLDHGGACCGLAFRVEIEDRDTVIDYLRQREQVTNVYREVVRPVALNDGRRVPALAYVVDRHHDQYAGRLDLKTQQRLVLAAQGRSGANVDYVLATARRLGEFAIADAALLKLAESLRENAP